MDLKDLKELWRAREFRPRKRMGQNFLIDNNVRDNILKELPLTESKTVLEIGSGFGVMSFPLASKCGRLLAVEKDAKICEIMGPVFAKEPSIELINSDILQVDISALKASGEKILVYGNVPYYISTPIIEKMINERSSIDALYMVIQDELADRIVASPGSKVYGSLSCYVQYYTQPKKLFRIKKNSFIPRPMVDSCLIRFEMLDSPSVKVLSEDLFFKIIRQAFSQRRKKAINPLSSGDFEDISRDDWKNIFEICGIDLLSRAEDLSLSDYARLSDTLRSYSGDRD